MPNLNPYAGYDPKGEGDHPLGGYAIMMSAFAGLYGAGIYAAYQRKDKPPTDVSTRDILLLGIATHKASRLITKERVTAPIRAPFTTYQAEGGHGEVEETARGSGLRRTIGELLICPYCIGQWIVAALSLGLLFAPRATRFFSSMLAAKAIGDAAQLAYAYAEQQQ